MPFVRPIRYNGAHPKTRKTLSHNHDQQAAINKLSRMLKLSDNPPVLHPAGKSLRDLPGRWWVAHTKPRSEKALAWDLVDRNVPYFLPMMLRTTFSGGRKRRGMIALFPGYLFICVSDTQRQAALMTNRVCRMIEVADQQTLLNELHALERALSEGAQFDLYPFAVVGQRCRIRTGPFEGIEGTIVSRDRLVKLVLQVSLLGCGAAMELDAGILDPV
jgi:transcription antitermination factor NusG